MTAHLSKTRRAGSDAGFTLIEILVALGILGVAMFILLDTHWNALNLYDQTQTEVKQRSLAERAMALAELEVLQGRLNGEEEFGERYPGMTYNWQAELSGDEQVPLYRVLVTIAGPDDDGEEFEFFTFNPSG